MPTNIGIKLMLHRLFGAKYMRTKRFTLGNQAFIVEFETSPQVGIVIQQVYIENKNKTLDNWGWNNRSIKERLLIIDKLMGMLTRDKDEK